MGLVKNQQIESEERGWEAPERNVCERCFEDEYLKGVISAAASENHCDYCNRTARKPIAAPLATVMDPISSALFAHFAEPGAAGLPRDSGEWIDEDEITDTHDALESLGLMCDGPLFDDIANAFHNTAWYPCANGFWLDLHEHQRLNYGWDHFVETVKHTSRYFFSRERNPGDSNPNDGPTPSEFLVMVADLVDQMELVGLIKKGTELFRVRNVVGDENLTTIDDVGPPPRESVSAGRMNPAGISYFYLATDAPTALAEVIQRPPASAIIARFKLKRDINVLDLSRLPPLPSIFDDDRRSMREGLVFLDRFVTAICKPTVKDGREHLDYVPSQVVSEFFSQIYGGQDRHIDGMFYPSAVRRAGTNLVLFPLREFQDTWAKVVDLEATSRVHFASWEELTEAIR